MGLTVNGEYIACGSETNDVFVYHKVSQTNFLICFRCLPQLAQIIFVPRFQKLSSLLRILLREVDPSFQTNLQTSQAISKPAAWHRFVSSDLDDADDDAGSYFISAVCWKSDSPTMLTANSQGTIKVLVLAA